MTKVIKNIVIVGGGTAGWLTAAKLAKKHVTADPDSIKVTLIESSSIGIVGVGEGSLPSMRNTLQSLGISETEFINTCDVTFKQGIKFVGWVDNAPDDFYYHGFNPPHDHQKIDLAPYWDLHHKEQKFAETVQFQHSLCEANLAPKLITHPEYQQLNNYAYHLDAGKFADFLKKYSKEKLGVQHIVDDVTAVNQWADDSIKSLTTARNGELFGDLFVDCSGFSSLLLGQTLKVPFVSKKDILFTDKAVTIRVPYETENAPVPSSTLTTAQKSGWIWDIGLNSRRGTGYVYSSAHCSEDEAEKTLRDYLGDVAKNRSAKMIKFTSGYRQQLWKHNCVAIGLSGSFLEPLEATALSVIEASADLLADQLPSCNELIPIAQRRFNKALVYRLDKIVDFIKMHYLLSQRQDSEFWRENRAPSSVPGSLLDLLEQFRYHSPSYYDFNSGHEPFQWVNYQYVLYGMGFKPDFSLIKHSLDQHEVAKQIFARNLQLKEKLLQEMPDHRFLLQQVRQHGFQVI
jgi:tryptophan halogenase